MDISLVILCVFVGFITFCTSMIKFIHFFQLNSYRVALQLRWIKKNPSKIVSNIFFGLIAVAGFVISGTLGGGIALIAFCLGLVTSRPKKAKKPLVYTMRVKRLIITCLIIYFVLIAVGANYDASLLTASLLFALCPIVILVANIINKPLENGIANYYTRDAKKILSSSNAKVIGITGSYGKTSVKYYLTTLLKAKYGVLMTPASYNTPMGVVKTIRSSLNAFHEIFVCEMGAKRVGEIKEICDIVNPEIGIITSVGPQHLQTFKSLDNIKKTKFELADSVGDAGLVFLNADDENIASYKGSRKHIGYSITGKGDYNASDIVLTDKGTTFTVTCPNGEKCDFSTKLIGSHNVLNITGAIAVSHTLGIELSQLRPQVAKLESVPHRLELIKKGKDVIIDDAFNSNPSGTKAALETLSKFDGFKILLTPGMVELGDKQDELNCEFGKNAAKVCDYVILVGRSQTQSIAKGLEESGFSADKIHIAPDFNNAINHAYSLNTKGAKKIILLENDLPDNY